jgi:hypothetical protein
MPLRTRLASVHRLTSSANTHPNNNHGHDRKAAAFRVAAARGNLLAKKAVNTKSSLQTVQAIMPKGEDAGREPRCVAKAYISYRACDLAALRRVTLDGRRHLYEDVSGFAAWNPASDSFKKKTIQLFDVGARSNRRPDSKVMAGL